MKKEWQELISKNFNEAATNYNTVAQIQNEVALKLATICSSHKIPNGIWVDLGSGTGFLANALEDLNPKQPVIRIDQSIKMLDQHPRNSIKEIWDLNNGLPPLNKKPSLIASSFALHWLNTPIPKLQQWFNALSPGGYLALALPVEGSFHEWHKAADAAGVACSSILLPSSNSIEECLQQSHFHSKQIYVITQKASNLISLLKPMILAGAQSSKTSPLRVGEWRRLQKEWFKSSINGEISLTWLIELLLIQK